MDKQAILDEMLTLLEQNGVIIRNEAFGGGGACLCKIQGKYTFFVDTQAPIAEILEICAETVAELVDIDSLYIKPEVRQMIEKCRRQKD